VLRHFYLGYQMDAIAVQKKLWLPARIRVAEAIEDSLEAIHAGVFRRLKFQPVFAIRLGNRVALLLAVKTVVTGHN
jgi:hypothetical protein